MLLCKFANRFCNVANESYLYHFQKLLQMKIYNVKEAGKVSGIPVRTISYLCSKDNIPKKNNVYQISEELLTKWIEKRQSFANPSQLQSNVANDVSNVANEIVLGKPKVPFKTTNANTEIQESGDEIQESYQEKLKRAIELITIEASKQNVQHKVFTEDEYIDLIGTLDRVEHQQEQIQYLRKRVERQDEILTNLFKNIERRDYIEAKDKGHDKK